MPENLAKKTKGLSAVIPKDNDGYCTVYKMDCDDGLGLMTVYQVYPGIQLIYNDFEATGCEWAGVPGRNLLEINHCREGREGSRLLSGFCLYLGESGINILEFKEKFCADGNCFIMRAKEEIEHIFSELYSVPDCLQKPYFKLKVQERPTIEELSKEYLINTATLKAAFKRRRICIHGRKSAVFKKTDG